jgi:hypothetical protein
MKRTPLVRRTPLKTKTALKRGTKLRVAGVSDVAQTKQRIQDLLRGISIKRDGGCIFRNIWPNSDADLMGAPLCGGYRKDGELILQADHLISRGNSATYADSRLVVCLCKGHHGWKSLGSNLRKKQYDEIVRQLLPKDRVELWDRCERDSWRPVRTYSTDWKLAELALKQELENMQ